jgi:diaminopimelate epimerase
MGLRVSPSRLDFVVYQALGNDYLVVEADRWAGWIEPASLVRLQDRHFGVGADGVLVRDGGGSGHLRVRVFNPDGSEAEKSGNGLRIFARYLWDVGDVDDAPFPVETAGGRVICHVLERGSSVRVEMGRASFDSREIPVVGPPREVLREQLVVAGRELEFSAATLGNPHCVLLRDSLSESEVRALGPGIENDARFPQRTNVQFAKVRNRGHLEAQIWERGAGYTLASGTSACAVAAVARRLDLCDASVAVHMPGGVLAIQVAADWNVTLTGPVTRVMNGSLDPGILEDKN